METNWRAMMALFYPLSIATVSAGMIAFVLILLNIDPLLIGAVTLWFYFISISTVYSITREALKAFGVRKIFLGLMIMVGCLAASSSLLFLVGVR